jgi:1,4-alpha-glucan branching enzyme
MIAKTFLNGNGNGAARVTFTLPNNIWADQIYLVGDFNEWNRTSHPLQRSRDGKWSITVDLELGRAYQFRYLRDGDGWLNDSQADAFVPTRYGSDNFLVITDPGFKQHCDRG